jgi:hypothetical protein
VAVKHNASVPEQPQAVSDHDRDPRLSPAIDRMSPQERQIFIRCLARIVLNRALEDLQKERASEPELPRG